MIWCWTVENRRCHLTMRKHLWKFRCLQKSPDRAQSHLNPPDLMHSAPIWSDCRGPLIRSNCFDQICSAMIYSDKTSLLWSDCGGPDCGWSRQDGKKWQRADCFGCCDGRHWSWGCWRHVHHRCTQIDYPWLSTKSWHSFTEVKSASRLLAGLYCCAVLRGRGQTAKYFSAANVQKRKILSRENWCAPRQIVAFF